MQASMQTAGVTVLTHGAMVLARYDALTEAIKQDTLDALTDWRLPEWLLQHREMIARLLMDPRIVRTYLLYHDCELPLLPWHIYVMEKKYTRLCPTCGKELSYAKKGALTQANLKGSSCHSCNTKKQYEDNPTKNVGAANGRTGVKVYDVFVNKYGQEEGDKRYAAYRARLSAATSGINNPAYGVPGYKQGGGMSYQGWYKDMFFRSSFELHFIMQYESANGCLPISAEKGFRILLDDVHTYTPDYFCPLSNTLFEVKSEKFSATPTNLVKYEAAGKYCTQRNLRFKIATEKDLVGLRTANELLIWLDALHHASAIKLTDKSLIKLHKAAANKVKLKTTND